MSLDNDVPLAVVGGEGLNAMMVSRVFAASPSSSWSSSRAHQQQEGLAGGWCYPVDGCLRNHDDPQSFT